MKDKIIPLLIILSIITAFLAGTMWTKIQSLEEGIKKTKIQPTQPTPEVPSGAGEKRIEVKISPNDPVKGNPEALLTIVEFSDFQCPFCGQAQETLEQILETYKDKVKLVYKDYPLPFHENAENAALAALCAKEQEKFWEYHDKLFANQEKLALSDLKKYAQDLGLDSPQFNSCLGSKKYKNQVDEDTNEGQRIGVSGTPAFFLNGREISGAQPFENFKEVIDEELGSP